MGMFIYPFLTLLLKTRLNFNELQIGYVMMAIAAANVSGSLFSGKAADRVGRKRVYMWSLFIGMIGLIAGGLVCESLMVIPFLVGVYFCVSMAMPAIAAMIADWSDDSNRNECFSLMYLCSNIGFAVGPFIAGFLFYSHTPWIFWGQAVSFGVAAVVAILWLHETYIPGAAAGTVPADSARGTLGKLPESGDAEEKAEREAGLFQLVFRSPVLACFIVCLAAFSVCYIQVDFLLPLQVEDVFGEELGSRYFGMISGANGLACVIGTPILVALTKRQNRLGCIAAAGLLYAVGFGSYAVVRNLSGMFLLVIVWTFGEVLVSTGAGVYIAEHSPATHRARFQSLYELSRAMGKAFGPTIFGYYLMKGTLRGAWILVAGICVGTSAVLFVLYLIEKRKKQRCKALGV